MAIRRALTATGAARPQPATAGLPRPPSPGTRRQSSQRRLKRGAIRVQRHLPREPLMVVFQTAKLRRGVQMFRPTRSNADGRQITTILQ